MRITRLLALIVIFVLFSSHAFAQQGLSGDIKPDPALAGIKELSVVVTGVDMEPNNDVLKRTNLKSEVINRLYDAGLKIGRSSDDASELNIRLTLFKIDSIGQYIVSVRTSLVRNVDLINGNEHISISADVWKMDSGLRIMTADKIDDDVPTIVREHVGAFIASCPPMVSMEKKPDVNQPRQQLRKVTVEKDEKPARQQDAEAKFVCSKNSDVFHKAGCPSAKRISPNNLITYATRDEAVNAGKKPCQRCNP